MRNDLLIEAPSRMEPCLLEQPGLPIVNAVSDLTAAAQSLGQGLHPTSAASLADLVRVMNCYYSNLIEGHDTTPREIEAAMSDRLDVPQPRRNLLLEARAHIRLQREIDERHAHDELQEPASTEFIRELHREFYRDAPPDWLEIRAGQKRLRMVPGKFRHEPAEEVTVGLHQPPSAHAVAGFMAAFEQRYRFEPMGKGERIIAMAAAHHRLNFIHPFLDGNGRVSRLMSHAMALRAGIGAHGLWSVSRGLARGLESRTDYKRMMNHADLPRQGDLDGRGNLSQRALAEFVLWFLRVCLDQVTFMGRLFALDSLIDRMKAYVAIRGFDPASFHLLEHALQRGQLARGDAPRVTGLKERKARDTLALLVEDGILGSETPKSLVSLRFPASAVEVLFPSIFPQR